MSENIKKLLEQQIVLLSEQSKMLKTSDDLALLSRAMVEIAEILIRKNPPLVSATEAAKSVVDGFCEAISLAKSETPHGL